jgi:iron(III) transport system substrate-binding protein
VTALVPGGVAQAQEKVLNLYSARHYSTDQALYTNFTKSTGIKINLIEAGDEAIIQRVKNEGANSPADVILMVDAARLVTSANEGLFQPLKSKMLESRIPETLRDEQGRWFGFSTRARVFVYNKQTVKPEDVATYASLADAKNKGKVCTRSGSHPYMLSLIGSVVAHEGPAAADQWARSVVANLARKPAGGDTDQIRAVASGECGVAVTNTYYLARLMRSDRPADKDVVAKTGLVWPNQSGSGTHVNISGGGIAKHAPNKDAAAKFLEYLASEQAQVYFADGNNEWAVVKAVKVKNPALDAMGNWKADPLRPEVFGRNTPQAQLIAERSGWR